MPAWILILVQIFPILMKLVGVAEVAFSGVPGKSGAAKKEFVTGAVSAVVDGLALGGVAGAIDNKAAIMGATGALIEAAVTTMKAVDAIKNPVADAGGPNE